MIPVIRVTVPKDVSAFVVLAEHAATADGSPVHQTHTVKVRAAMARVERLRHELREARVELEGVLREATETP